MAQDMIDKIIPESGDEQVRALAAKFVAELIKTAVDQLIPTAGDNAGMREFPASSSRIFDVAGYLDGGNMIDTVDLDTLIEHHLNHLSLITT